MSSSPIGKLDVAKPTLHCRRARPEGHLPIGGMNRVNNKAVSLGWAFKKKDKTTREVELMVFLRPKVSRTPEEARQLLEEIYRQSPKIKNWKDGVQDDDSAKGHNPKPNH